MRFELCIPVVNRALWKAPKVLSMRRLETLGVLNEEPKLSSDDTNFSLVNRSRLTAVNCSDVGTNG